MDWQGLLGLGSLRDELSDRLQEPARTAILDMFDGYLRDASSRAAGVERWQSWVSSRGVYEGFVNGIWGKASESAFNFLAPGSYGKRTTLNNLLEMESLGADMQSLLAIGAARDLWLATNPELPTQAGTAKLQVSSPKTIPRVATEETVTVGEGAGSVPTRVEITLPSGERETVTIRPVEEKAGNGGDGWPSWSTWLVVGASAFLLLMVIGRR